MRHSRTVGPDAPPGALNDAAEEVRSHLSAAVDYGDDEHAHVDVVTIWQEPDGDAVKVVGEIDGEPDAPYLRDDFDPDADTEFTFQRYSEDGRE